MMDGMWQAKKIVELATAKSVKIATFNEIYSTKNNEPETRDIAEVCELEQMIILSAGNGGGSFRSTDADQVIAWLKELVVEQTNRAMFEQVCDIAEKTGHKVRATKDADSAYRQVTREDIAEDYVGWDLQNQQGKCLATGTLSRILQFLERELASQEAVAIPTPPIHHAVRAVRAVRAENLPIASIDLTRCIREVDHEHVAVLAKSIAEIGLVSPIACAEFEGVKYLISGRHRLEAFKSNGERVIPAVIITVAEADAIDAAIDANIIAKLSPLDRAMHLDQARQEYLRREEGKKRRGSNSVKFTEFLSSRFGMKERACRRALSIAAMPSTTIKLLADSEIRNNEGKLYAISRIEDTNEQATVVLEIQEYPKKTIQQARIDAGIDNPPPQTDAKVRLDALLAMWRKCDMSIKTTFLDAIENDIRKIGQAQK